MPALLTAHEIYQACELWRRHETVAIPTETVYGLAADATSDQGVATIFHTKGRPQFNPLIVHVATLEKALEIAVFCPLALQYAATFWPGPLTLVLPRTPQSRLSHLVSAGLDTVAIRIPAHPMTLQLLQAYENPIAAPSANRSNDISPTSAADVYSSLGEKVPLILDGGSCSIGLESTIIDLTEDVPVLLRPGGICIEDLQTLMGPIRQHEPQNGQKEPLKAPLKAPGMMKRHYAPQRPLRLQAQSPYPGEAFLAFGPHYPQADLNLSPTGCVREAAASLFRMMRQLDTSPFTGIAVSTIPMTGLGVAINDRLTRAATPADVTEQTSAFIK